MSEVLLRKQNVELLEKAGLREPMENIELNETQFNNACDYYRNNGDVTTNLSWWWFREFLQKDGFDVSKITFQNTSSVFIPFLGYVARLKNRNNTLPQNVENRFNIKLNIFKEFVKNANFNKRDRWTPVVVKQVPVHITIIADLETFIDAIYENQEPKISVNHLEKFINSFKTTMDEKDQKTGRMVYKFIPEYSTQNIQKHFKTAIENINSDLKYARENPKDVVMPYKLDTYGKVITYMNHIVKACVALDTKRKNSYK